MDKIYNQDYYENYDTGIGKVNYKDSPNTKDFLQGVAQQIAKMKVRTVLDVGCAMGHLVAGLRDLGVEAYGIDISEYAISEVRDDIKPYCNAQAVLEDLPKNFPEKFDLAITIEVFEHIQEDDARAAIGNLCKWSDTVIFCSTPDDFEDPTHVNVRQREYWSRLFAEQGFYNDLDTKPSYITNYAVCYRRKSELISQIESYERHIRLADALHQTQLLQAKKHPFVSTVYWGNEEHGLCEEQTATATGDKSQGIIYFHIQVPPSVSILRFDPIEAPCVVEDLHIYSNAGSLQVIAENGIEYQGKYVFLDRDPRFQILMDGKQITSLDVRAHVIPLEYPEQEELLAQLFHGKELASQENRQLLEELAQQRKGYEATMAESQAAYEAAMAESQAAHKAAMAESQAAHEAALAELSGRHQADMEKQKESYQDMLDQREQTIESQLQKLAEMEENQSKLLAKQQDLQNTLDHYYVHYHAAIGQREELKQQLAQVQNAYNVISNAFFWKITKPARVLVDCLKKPFRNSKTLRLASKGFRCLKENGFKYTWHKVQDKLHHRKDYVALAQKALFTPEQLEAQRNFGFSKKIKFSIVVPLYNTPQKFLHEMIQSVIDQTYGDWELCMADGSDGAHGDVGQICRGYAKKDSRIKYKKLEKNMGISGNTNACIEMATGDYIGLFDHDDLLHPAALYEVMRTICETGADFIYTDENTFHNEPKDAFCPHFKPDYAPDTLRSYNYICHFTVFEKGLLEKIGGGFRSEFDGSQDYDLVLRLTEQAKNIVHIPEILYYWRAHRNSVAENIGAKPYTLTAARRALAEHLERVGLKGEVMDSTIPSTYRIKYEIEGEPLVSIIIPNKDHKETLETCITSILEKTTYQNYEIIIVENNSTEDETFAYYEELVKNPTIHLTVWEGPFNYSAINNYGIQQKAKGDYYLLLNNDVEILTPDWIQEMLMFAQRSDVGAVGAMLYYPDDTIQHAGVIIGIGGVGGHAHKYFPRNSYGYMSRAAIAQNYSAVTAACVLIPKRVWDEVEGLDEGFQVAFNDVDLCMRIRKAGYLIVWTPYAELYHYESKSRGLEDTPEKQKRFAGEVKRFMERWKKELDAGDPYYNPNLTLEHEDFSIKV